ncbi:MAG: glutamate--cysteine ligase [Gammaproteobacteria bacterium]|nr:glutamate--cysteine ligase [Gammaproteobacteria bacterium]
MLPSFESHKEKIEAWFKTEFEKTLPPPYCSVDLRNAQYKIAPVDTNLFPAGFNNLHICAMPSATVAAKSLANYYVNNCQRILLIPENHTRNTYYFESLATLQTIFMQAGFGVKVGSLLPDLVAPMEINLPSGRNLILDPVVKDNNNRLGVKDFDPCLILLNHDLSDGIPEILKNVKQKIAPPMQLGWWSRWKSDHFKYYQDITEEFAELLNIDPWLLNPLFDYCENIDFVTREGEEGLITKTQALLNQISEKYKKYNITDKPYVVIKADAGTYGMGILPVFDVSEIKNLNRKQRTKMSSTKGAQKINRVIIQEGVYTVEKRGEHDATAEPVMYMIGDKVVGGFYRVHKDKKPDENLNAPGMQFESFCVSNYNYNVIARLALLASAREIQGVKCHQK